MNKPTSGRSSSPALRHRDAEAPSQASAWVTPKVSRSEPRWTCQACRLVRRGTAMRRSECVGAPGRDSHPVTYALRSARCDASSSPVRVFSGLLTALREAPDR